MTLFLYHYSKGDVMILHPRKRAVIVAVAIAAGGLAVYGVAAAQSESQHQGSSGMQGGMGQGMGGMMGMMQGCPMMRGGGMGQGMHLPAGNEKLEMQMHADMMRAMADVLTKYAARLPDKK
jgi:hypothetical protein